MNLSAILVLVRPDQLDACAAALNRIQGVEVHHRDPTAGRLIVTQEAETVSDEIDGFRRIQAQPDVITAELVYHWFEEDESLRTDEAGGGLLREGGVS
ncbi:MAG: chaperone NapD [Chromatiales bacterium]|jgi:nitrate reductase NapD